MLNISYPFRKLLTITQSGNDLLPDHQVCLTIPYMFGMQSTFTDLCFEDVFGRHCPHWVESYESGVSAKVWVRAPLVGKNTQLFLKYGTPVVNLSNSDATFLLFDDFPGNSLNSDKWSEVSGSNITVQNSKLILNKTSSNVSGVRAISPVFSNEVEFEIKYSTYTAIKYSFYFSLRSSLAGSSGVLVYHETTGGRKLWIMDTSGNYAQSNINTPPEGPLTFRIKRNTSSGAVRVYYDDSLILSKTVDSYRNSPIYFGMEYGDSADSATGTAEIDSIIARSSTDSTFELAEVQDSPERRLWYFEEPPPQEHSLHITGSSHLLQFFPVRIYIPESINVSNWDKLDFYQGEDQLAYWYDEGRYVWVRVLEIPTQGADITMIVGQTGDQDPEKVFSDFEEHETPFQLGPAEGEDVYYLQRQVSVQHCIRVRLTALSSVIKFDVGFASNLTYTQLGYHFDSNNSALYGFYTSPPWSRFDSQGSLVSAEDMVGYVEFEVKNETIRAKCGGGQWSTSSGSSLINSSAYLSTVGNDNWVKFDQVLVYKTVSDKKPVGYFYIGTKDCGFSLVNSPALSKECEFSLINSPTLNKDCGFALIDAYSTDKDCGFSLTTSPVVKNSEFMLRSPTSDLEGVDLSLVVTGVPSSAAITPILIKEKPVEFALSVVPAELEGASLALIVTEVPCSLVLGFRVAARAIVLPGRYRYRKELTLRGANTLHFDGVDDYATFPVNLSSNSTISVAMLVAAGNYASTGLLETNDGVYWGNFHSHLFNNNGDLYIGMVGEPTGMHRFEPSMLNFKLQKTLKWLVYTWNSVTKEAKLYYDGTLRATRTFNYTPSSITGFRIPNTSNCSYKHLSILNRVLTQADVTDLAVNGRLTDNRDSLLGEYCFLDGPGSVVSDCAGDNHGVVVGAGWEPSSVEDVALKVSIPYQLGMSPAFTDLRFSDVFNKWIPHWVEDYDYGIQATVWVRLPVIVGKTTIYLEYGNNGLQDLSDEVSTSHYSATITLDKIEPFMPSLRLYSVGIPEEPVVSVEEVASSLVLIKPESKELEAGFALSAIVPESDFRECAFALTKSVTRSKTQTYSLVVPRDTGKDCGFEVTSTQFNSLIDCSFSLVGASPAKTKSTAFQLTRQVIYKPLELRLIATSSASKSSGFSLAESLAIDEFGATVSFTEVASSCQPILVSAVTKNAGFTFGVPSVEVPELELFTSATEVPVSVVIHLHKASTKSAGFAFEDAKWVILVNTSLKISPKALESNAAAILHKERAKASEFEIDEINPVQLNSVTINNSEVWTTALRFVVVPGLGSGGDVQKLSKKLSFAIEHDTPYDDTSEEYFSRINGYLHPYDFSPVKHKHDDFYPTKNEVVSTYALDTTKVIAGDTIVPADRGGSAFQLVVITSDNLASWQSGSRQLSWTFRWEHLGLGFGPIGLTSNVTKASYTLDLKTFMRLYLAIVQGNLAQASSDVQNIWATYFDQVAYFYKHGTLDGHPGGDYSATWNLTVWNSAGAANNAWNTPANRGYLYTSRWDPHRFDLFFYRKHPAYLVADYHVKLPAIGGKTPKVVTAVAFPGGEVPSSMDISTMVSSDYTGQSLMGRSIISRAHTGFSIRGINGDTVIVRSFGKPFYIVALITFDNTFDTIDEWDTSPDRFLKGTKEIKSSHTRIAASFSIKPWLVG